MILKGTAEMEAEMTRFRKGPASVRLHTPMFWDTADAAGFSLKGEGERYFKAPVEAAFFYFLQTKKPSGFANLQIDTFPFSFRACQ